MLEGGCEGLNKVSDSMHGNSVLVCMGRMMPGVLCADEKDGCLLACGHKGSAGDMESDSQACCNSNAAGIMNGGQAPWHHLFRD